MKTKFSLEKFVSSNLKTLEITELNSVIGAGMHGMCSVSNDTDSQSSECSNHTDVDGAR